MMIQTIFHTILSGILIVGGVLWGLVGIFGFSLMTLIGKMTGPVARILYIVVGFAALYMAFQHSPFSDETQIPCSVLVEKTPEHADTEVILHSVEPGKKILYWATEAATEGLAKIRDWRHAYMDYTNAGVVTVNPEGRATLLLRKPQPSVVPLLGRIEPYVRWRICEDNGLLGAVQTTNITGGPL
jgi:uncharacterized protein